MNELTLLELSKRYDYVLGSYAPTQASDRTNHYNVHTDHLQTPKWITNSEGAIVWRSTREAFGEMMVEGSYVTFNFRFPGQYYDAESGLYYNHYRYYDPKLGRYITSDPIGLGGGINRFAYVGGNPVGVVDPLDLKPREQWYKAG